MFMHFSSLFFIVRLKTSTIVDFFVIMQNYLYIYIFIFILISISCVN